MKVYQFLLVSLLMIVACRGTEKQTNFVQENEFALSPPIVKTGETLFQDSVRVEMKLGMPEVEIYYTLDGATPDAGSLHYDGPFFVAQTATLQAITMADGWKPSEAATVSFRRMGRKVAEAFLAAEPSQAYPGEGAASLIDGKKGSANFRDGRWLGYEGENLEAILDLGETLSSVIVSVSCLEDPGSWIFYPSEISVEGSLDGVTYDEISLAKYEVCDEGTAGSQQFLEIPWPDIEVRFLKVKVFNRGTFPVWHPGAAEGGKPWLFVDEILISE